ncbi:histone deacetylase [Acinetobacter tibetensis]|uniref:histone deacetylase n=1 Tax=Acinetobacter TaxID=469 RepID=UPI000DE6D3AC|nr:histone deacetylase [Acinetobacter sp. AM]PWB16492.1 histone deacetylase [Acinetobacter sp. AM]
MLQVCYSPQYFAQTHTNSMEKLTAVAEALKPLGITKFHTPDPLAIDILKQLHAPEYVDAFHTGMPEKMATFQGFKPWNTQLRDAVYQINAGQILAAELAWKHQISANIAQGFHHAIYEFGSSFCTFNGLALIAKKFPNKRIFVLDCDQHGGNGTAEFTKRYENLFNYSIYGLAFGCPTYERSETSHIHKHNGNFSQYILAIHHAFKRAIEWNADLIVYQAGMDCHQDDPCGSSWFSTELIEKRDEIIFRLAKKNQIPLMFVLAGGYQALPELVQLHLSTFKTAHQIYY